MRIIPDQDQKKIFNLRKAMHLTSKAKVVLSRHPQTPEINLGHAIGWGEVKSFSLKSNSICRPEDLFNLGEIKATKYYQKRFEGAHDTALHENETYKKISDSLKKLTSLAGLPEDLFSLCIYRVHDPVPLDDARGDLDKMDLPDAHILPALAHINISEKLLEVLDYRLDLVEAVLAHEIGHYMQAIYNKEQDLAVKPQGRDANFDPIEKKIQSYDEEYQADRLSVNLMSNLGKNPNLINEALVKIKEFYRADEEENGTSVISGNNFASLWVLNTHPHTERRITSNKRLTRLLPGNKGLLTQESLKTISDDNWHTPFISEVINGHEEDFNLANQFDSDKFLRLGRTLDFAELYKNIDQDTDPLTSLDTTDQESVEQFDDSCFKEIQEWWEEAVLSLFHEDTFTDIQNDISDYSIESIKTILLNLNLYSLMNEGYLAFEDEYREPIALISHLLTKEWYRKVSNLAQDEQVKQIIDLIDIYRNYQENKGFVLCDNRFFLMKLINENFPSFSDNQKNQIINELERNMEYLAIPLNPSTDQNINDKYIVDRRLNILEDLPNLTSWLDPQNRKLKLPESLYKQEKSKTLDLVKEKNELTKKAIDLEKAIDDPNFNPDEVKDFLTKECADLFKKPNMTFSIIDNAGQYRTGELSDAIAKNTSSKAAYLMGTEEFEEEYFGRARDDHDQIPYTLLEHDNRLLTAISNLWQKVFSAELSTITEPNDKLKFIGNTSPYRSLYRDQLIVGSLNFTQKLNFSDDLMKIQEDILKLTDLETLDLLLNLIKNPALKMACSFRIAELLGVESNEKPIKNSLQAVSPNTYLVKKFDEIAQDLRKVKDFPLEYINQDFLSLMFAYQYSSYKRDELLKPWIDNAKNENTKLAVASFLSEPPINTAGTRKTEHILITETLYDVFSKLERIDKEEALLYLLGHRRFASAIDAQFDPSYKLACLYHREKAMYDKSTVDKDSLTYIPDTAKKRFKRPDSIIEITKNCGCPPEAVFEQHKLTSTERERLEAIDFLLRGDNGILNNLENKKRFIKKAANLIVDKFNKTNQIDNPDNLKGLLEHVLIHCPESKISKLFLDIWDLSTNENTSLPQLMTQLIRSYGPVMVKFGQFLSTQDLPKEWKDEFRKLCSDNTTADSTLIYSYVGAAFKESPFVEIGKKIKEGSIAATYEGSVFTNEELKTKKLEPKKVAVKIYHPFIANELDEDIHFVEEIVKYLKDKRDIFGFNVPANTPELIEEMMLQQIDPVIESKGAEDLRKHTSREQLGVRFTVPSLIKEASASNVLSYDFDTGIELDKEDELSKIPILAGKSPQLRHAIGLEVLRQILFEGVYQADPNLGNFVARAPLPHEKQDKPVIVWHDPGDIGYLTQYDRRVLISFIKAFSDIQNINWNAASNQFIEFLQDPSTRNVKELLEGWVTENKARLTTDSAEKILEEFMIFCETNNLLIKQKWLNVISTLKKLRPLIYDYTDLPQDLKSLFIANKLAFWK